MDTSTFPPKFINAEDAAKLLTENSNPRKRLISQNLAGEIIEDYKKLPTNLPTFRDPDTYLYAREYHGKMMLGIFEPKAKNAFKKTGKVPNNFSFFQAAWGLNLEKVVESVKVIDSEN